MLSPDSRRASALRWKQIVVGNMYAVTGFRKTQVLTTCVWLLVATTAFQILNILATPVFGPIIPCPYDTLFLTIVAFLALYALWFWHLGTGKTGTFSKFGSLIVVPFAGDMFLNSKQATETGAVYLVNLAAIGFGPWRICFEIAADCCRQYVSCRTLRVGFRKFTALS